LHNETKGGIFIKIEFNLQKNISLLQHDRRFFVYSSNMAAVMSCEHTLYIRKKQTTTTKKKTGNFNRGECLGLPLNGYGPACEQLALA